jgi:hypothetical protein
MESRDWASGSLLGHGRRLIRPRGAGIEPRGAGIEPRGAGIEPWGAGTGPWGAGTGPWGAGGQGMVRGLLDLRI